MQTEQYINSIKEGLEPYKSLFHKAVDAILDNEISNFPILVVYQKKTVELGVSLTEHTNINGIWSVNASSLEEFVTKSLINDDKVENFKKVYKDPKTHFCLFVIEKIGATFVFIPRN